MNEDAVITLELKSPEDEKGHIRLEDFLTALRKSLENPSIIL